MAKTDFRSHDEYLATLTPEQRKVLAVVRATIAKAVPDASEVISYQVPAFKVGKGWVFYYSAHKEHWSLSCPPPQTHVGRFKDPYRHLR